MLVKYIGMGGRYAKKSFWSEVSSEEGYVTMN